MRDFNHFGFGACGFLKCFDRNSARKRRFVASMSTSTFDGRNMDFCDGRVVFTNFETSPIRVATLLNRRLSLGCKKREPLIVCVHLLARHGIGIR
jgi:hypothetical protein